MSNKRPSCSTPIDQANVKKIRIKGLSQEYKFLNWVEASLQRTPPELEYVSFAEQFEGTEEATNTNYKDLLLILQTRQSNRLTSIAHSAGIAFNVYAYSILNYLTIINLLLLYHRTDIIKIQTLERNIRFTGETEKTKPWKQLSIMKPAPLSRLYSNLYTTI
jgi:hypothetical protein